MSYEIGTASDMGDLLIKLDDFLTVGHALEPQYATAGDGEIENLIGTVNSVVETITVTFTSAAAFSVSGSVSGALGTGTVGTAFTSSRCAFTITPGSVPFASGDAITFVMTPPWVHLRRQNIGTGTDEYIWRAPGNDGMSEIYVGMRRFANDSADYDNVRLGGFTGYSSGQVFASQPGPCTNPVMPGLRIGAIPYWFIANGRRVMVFIKCASVYEGAYLGFLRQYWRPDQWPYPLVVGGSMVWSSEPAADSTNWKWSYQGTGHNLIVFCNQTEVNSDVHFNLRLRRPDGRWRGFGVNVEYANNVGYGFVWPYNGGRFTNIRPNLDGSYPLFPITLSEEDVANNVRRNPAQYGEMDGMFAVPGYENAAENIIIAGRAKYLVLQDVYRAFQNRFCAVKLT